MRTAPAPTGMGTLLGAYRNNGTIIAWDTDADLYISEDDEQRLLDALGSSEDFGHYYEKDHSPKRRPMYWIYYEKNQPTSSPGMGDTHVEIWMWKWKKPENKQIIYPLQQCPLYGEINALCPAQIEALLNKHYPLGWKSKYSLTGGRTTLNLSIM